MRTPAGWSPRSVSVRIRTILGQAHRFPPVQRHSALRRNGAPVLAGHHVDTPVRQGKLRLQADGSYRWDESPLRRMTGGEVYAAHVDPDGVAWAGTFARIVRYNPVVPKNYAVQFPALIRRVSGIDGKIHFAGAGRPARPSLPHESDSLRFEFAAPSFEDESRTEYRVLLDSFDSQWSPWTPGTHKDYTNLPKGSYKFHVEARNLYGATKPAGRLRADRAPPVV